MAKKRKNEIEIYVLHILMENPLFKVMNQKVANVIKKYGAAIIPMENFPVLYLQSLAFAFSDQRNDCGKELEKLGVLVAYELTPTYTKKEYYGAAFIDETN